MKIIYQSLYIFRNRYWNYFKHKITSKIKNQQKIIITKQTLIKVVSRTIYQVNTISQICKPSKHMYQIFFTE